MSAVRSSTRALEVIAVVEHERVSWACLASVRMDGDRRTSKAVVVAMSGYERDGREVDAVAVPDEVGAALRERAIADYYERTEPVDYDEALADHLYDQARDAELLGVR